MIIIKLKKKYLIIILIAIIASISTSSAGMPELSISVSEFQKMPEHGNNAIGVYSNENVGFNVSVSGGFSTNTRITKATWDFGDGSPETGTTITHNFKNNDWYDLKLTVNTNDDAGNNIAISNSYKIYAMKRSGTSNPATPSNPSIPELSVTVSNFQPLPAYGSKAGQVYYNEKLIFNSLISGEFANKAKITQATWNFGDGTKKTGISTDHTFKKTGWYTISLVANTIDNAGKKYTSSNTYRLYAVKRNPSPELSLYVSSFQPLPKYGNKTAQVNLNEKLAINALISGSLANKTKITKATWSFSDGTKKNGIAINHTFKKTGWYTINLTTTSLYNKNNYISTNSYKIYVVKKPDLILTSLKRNFDKKKNVANINVIIKNKGALTSKSSYVKIWYSSTNLKKYSKTASVKSLKPGQSTKLTIKFQIPYKYRNYAKNIKVDSTKKIAESIEINNQLKFK